MRGEFVENKLIITIQAECLLLKLKFVSANFLFDRIWVLGHWDVCFGTRKAFLNLKNIIIQYFWMIFITQKF